jgi:hypothetical protein
MSFRIKHIALMLLLLSGSLAKAESMHHLCSYSISALTISNYSKIADPNNNFTFDLAITTDDTCPVYNGRVVIAKISGANLPERLLDTIQVTILPGKIYTINSLVFPKEYLPEYVAMFGEDSIAYLMSIIFPDSDCKDEYVTYSYQPMRVLAFNYTFVDNTNEVASSFRVLTKDKKLQYLKNTESIQFSLYNAKGISVSDKVFNTHADLSGLTKGNYLVKVEPKDKKVITENKKAIVYKITLE